ncbi:hypothetical protein PAJ34TS1_30220 [Paenibacillus azoreducens]|uniref:Uncharacterized protein n=1 Tax=Paenibacillus azoreducens TaxID=116718 RepID=A0A920CS79_9BACL|nr:hypothetical protein J34TS1_18470 [Paenibacillus azoreducens]
MRSSSVPGTDAGGTLGEFKGGDKVNISLQLLLDSGSTYKVKFYVNGVHKHTFELAKLWEMGNLVHLHP